MKLVYEVLTEAANARSKKEKVEILKKNESWGLKDVIKGSLDSTVSFNLPEGPVPYVKAEGHNFPSNLLKRHKDFRYFVKGGPGDKMPAFKRESIFIGLLEAIHPEDAELVVSMINKKLGAKVSRSVIDEAFPGLIQD